MIARGSFALSPISALIFGLAVAACGGTASTSPGVAAQTNTVAGATTVTSGGSQGHGQQGGGSSVEDGLGHPVNVCQLLPAAIAASISGEAITQATEDDTTSYKIYACNYASADGTTGFRISVLALDAAAGYDGDLSANGTGAKPISGLGDKAFSGIGGLDALFGNVSITVSNLQSDAAATALIRNLQPKL